MEEIDAFKSQKMITQVDEVHQWVVLQSGATPLTFGLGFSYKKHPNEFQAFTRDWAVNKLIQENTVSDFSTYFEKVVSQM